MVTVRRDADGRGSLYGPLRSMIMPMAAAVFAGGCVFPLPECSDEVAAVRKSDFLADDREGRICEKKQFFPFFYTDKLYVVLAGAAVQFFETFREMRVTHMTHICKLFYFDRLMGVSVDKFRNIAQRRFRFRTKRSKLPYL